MADHNEALSARYTLDFTNTLDGGKAAVITDTVTQCGLYLYSDRDSLAFGMVNQQAERIAELEAELDQLRAEVERLRRLCVEQAQALIDRPVKAIDHARTTHKDEG